MKIERAQQDLEGKEPTKLRKCTLMILFLLVPLHVWAESGWRFVTPMPHGRYGHSATLGTDGKIYVRGGMACNIKQDGSISVKEDSGVYSNLVYDPRKDTWEYRTPVPGWESGGTFCVYDPEKKRWQALKSIRHKGDLLVLKKVSPLGVEGEYLEMSPDKLSTTPHKIVSIMLPPLEVQHRP